MNSQEFWTSISVIIRNGFDREGLYKLEEYAKRFINGQLLFKRYTEDEQLGCAAGGTLHVIASILAGAETPTGQLTAPEHSFKREQQQAKAQASVIEQWSKAVGCWTDNVDTAFPYLYLSDMHDENVLKTPQGNILVIDCDIRLNTQELRCDGLRTLTNEVCISLSHKDYIQ